MKKNESKNRKLKSIFSVLTFKSEISANEKDSEVLFFNDDYKLGCSIFANCTSERYKVIRNSAHVESHRYQMRKTHTVRCK